MEVASLSMNDVQLLAGNRSIENKSNVAKKVTKAYNSNTLSKKSIKLAEDIFRIMVKDTEIRVRKALAESLMNSNYLPQDVVENIINDDEFVAVPFLQYYEALNNEDLLKILKMQGVGKHKAIAKRSNLSGEISDFIVKSCKEEVVEELVSNKKAEIKEKTLDSIVQKYSQSENIKNGLIHRNELPVSVISKIVDKLSYNLKKYLVLHHNLPKNIASDVIEDVKEKITFSVSEEYSSDKQVEELVHQLYKANKLNPNLAVRAVCLGDVKFFEYALVYLSETPIAEVRKILFNNDADFVIRNLLRKAFIPKTVFPAVFCALKVIKDVKFDYSCMDRASFSHKVVERILSYMKDNEELDTEDIKYLISKIK